MFTGIIKEMGTVRRSERNGSLVLLEVESENIFKSAVPGASIAINGVCLTMVKKVGKMLSFDVMGETLTRSNLGGVRAGEKVNLEPALKTGEALDGHFVLGHADCVGKIAGMKRAHDNVAIHIKFPEEFGRFVVEKGSVAIDGISLTACNMKRGAFSVYIIPHTMGGTTLGHRKTGDRVNIEFDIIGKYILNKGEPERATAVTEEFLKTRGFA